MMPAYSHVASSVVLPKKVCRRLKLCEVSVAAMKVELRRLDFWRAVIGECLATLLYVLLGCSSTLACETHYANAAPSTSDAHYVVVALCFGLTSMALTYGFCHISDAHLNPVVSVAMTVTCRITPLRAAMYTLAQLGGAVAGAAILYGLVPSDWQSERGLVTLHENLSEGRGFGLEFLTTFLLVFLIFASGDPGRKEPSQRAVVIGLTITTCHLATYKFTRSAMNPARALGPAFVMNHWSHHWVYWAGPMAGGVLAGVLYEYIFDPSRGKKRSPATPSKRASMIDDPELLSVTYPSSVHTNRCTRDSYVSNGVPCDIYTSCPNTKTIYYPNIMAPYNNSGLENQAYSSDGRHQRSLRLIQDTAPPPPPPAPPESGEIILMEDVGNRIYNDRLR